MGAAAAAESNTSPSSISTPSPRRRWARRIAKFLLPGTSLLIVLLALEVGMRIAGVSPQTATVLSSFFEYDEQTGWRGKPEAHSQFTTMNFDVAVSHDANGFRRSGYELPIETDATSKDPIAWVVGDSGTWGWGVPDGKTYVDLLNRLSDDGTRYRNLGHCGFSSVQQYLLLKSLFEEGKKPKEVVVLFCGNDVSENLDAIDQKPGRAYLDVHGDVAEIKNYPTLKSGWGFLVWMKNNSLAWNHAHFYIRRAQLMRHERNLTAAQVEAKQATERKAAAENSKPATDLATTSHAPVANAPAANVAAPPIDPLSSLPREQIVGLRFIYREMRDLCSKHDVKLRIVNEGMPVVPVICGELGIDCLSLAARLKQHAESPQAAEPIAFNNDPHFNELGHQLLGEAIHSELKRVRSAETLAAKARADRQGDPARTATSSKTLVR